MSFFNRKLDWKPKWDPKSNLFLISDTDCFDNGSARENILRTKKVWLDQGREGACTGFGTGHVLAASPKSRLDIVNETAQLIYYEARRQDEWPGEDYDGSSVNGAMRAARLMGYITEWRWCKTMAEVRHALSYHGPLVIGVNWYTGMFTPNARGLLTISGTLAGGHALMVAGYKFENGQYWYRLENSWGPAWGDNGGCWISEANLYRLLGERGEFACPKKVAA